MCARFSVLVFRRKLPRWSVILNVVLVLYFTTTSFTSHKVYNCHAVVPKINGSEDSHKKKAPTTQSALSVSLQEKIYPDAIECVSGELKPSIYQRGQYWVLENYIPAARVFPCNQSITYTTHADYTYLDNLEPLTSRWQGPVSVAVYAPGADFDITLKNIIYLRDCVSENIKNSVTFHIFFDDKYTPEVPSTEVLLARKTDCLQEMANLTSMATNRHHHGLLYPVNVARNTARHAAQTYFVLPSDIELYPSINFIPEFFKLLREPDVSSSSKPRVYVLPSFQIKPHLPPPATKINLTQHVLAGSAVPFFTTLNTKFVKSDWSQEWIKHPEESGLSVFHVEPSGPLYYRWEPIYVGTNHLPLYDERLYLQGKGDKTTQMYALCAKDYELHILDNAFVVGSLDNQQGEALMVGSLDNQQAEALVVGRLDNQQAEALMVGSLDNQQAEALVVGSLDNQQAEALVVGSLDNQQAEALVVGSLDNQQAEALVVGSLDNQQAEALVVGSLDNQQAEAFHSDIVVKQLSLIMEKVIPELNTLFGRSDKCTFFWDRS